MTGKPSPALGLPGAVPPPPIAVDQGVPWHYGDPHGEQRRLAAGRAIVDQSNLAVLTVGGPDRLTWLHSLTSGWLADLAPGQSATALVLDPQGHVEFELHVVDDGEQTWLIVEPEVASALHDYLDRMRFLLRVEVADVTADYAVLWRADGGREGQLAWQVPAEYAGTGTTPAGSDRGGEATKYVGERPGRLLGAQVIVPRGDLLAELASGAEAEAVSDAATGLAGTWALEALRVAAGMPRLGCETDHKTIPHEVGWIGPAVHLAKGCYRGQETVARVHNMGRPPRRLVLLHLDGAAEGLPDHGDAVFSGERQVGWIGTAARHHELGPIATAIVKRNVPDDAALLVVPADGSASIAAAVEPIVLG